MSTTRYGFSTRVPGTIDEVVDKTTAALGAEGFGVLTTIDVAGVLKKKLDKDVRPYRILGACNPHLASQAVDAEPHIGLLLPCNVLVQQDSEDACTVSFLDPDAMFSMVDNDAITPIAQDAKARLGRVAAALG